MGKDILEYTTSTLAQLEAAFKTSASSGLRAEQIAALKKQYGPNALKEHETSWVSLLIRQFNNPLMYLLIGAATASFFLESKTNSIFILAIVFINGFLSFFQEFRAHQTLKLLKKNVTHTAHVIRDGKKIEIASSELVPGDVIMLATGDKVPADVRLITGSLALDESLLTGESAPVKKLSTPLAQATDDPYKAINICYLATTVTAGSATGVVLATGSQTRFGNVSRLTVETMHVSGFEERLSTLSKFILAIMAITVICLFAVHLILKGSQVDIIQLLLFSIALSLGLTPEALPAVTTFALSQGALLLAKHNVVVKRLSAIEDLGAITILCTDKTGTLTENKMSVEHVAYADTNLTLYSVLVSKSTPPLDPFDTATYEYASDDIKKDAATYRRLQEIPYDPLGKRSSVLVSKANETALIVRGAMEVIEELCTPLPNRTEIYQWIADEAEQGNRVLALAYKKTAASTIEDAGEKGLTFGGLVSFHDPIKGTSVQAVTKAHALGITLKMITGDSKEVACAVAKKIGLAQGECLAIAGIEFSQLSPAQKAQIVKTYNVFARFTPEQKFEIVNLLKLHGDTDHSGGEARSPVIGFLGDGINDAPALKAAHVALAVQHASDTARDAADIILLKKSLLVIIDGISIGRQVFSNTIKYITASISSSTGNFYSIAIASLLIDFLPLLPLQILLVNLLSDFPMVAIATDTVDPDELLKPHEHSMKEIAFITITLGVVNSLFDFIFFAFFIHKQPAVLQTNWFILNILTELTLIYSIRTRGPFYKARRPSLTLMGLTLAVACITFALPFSSWGRELFQFIRPNAHSIFIVCIITVAYFFTTETVKLLYYRITDSITSKAS